MMWTDKAFGIWMGHAGEDTQSYHQDDTSIDVRALERTQVLAIARRDVTATKPAARSRSQVRDAKSERLAA